MIRALSRASLAAFILAASLASRASADVASRIPPGQGEIVFLPPPPSGEEPPAPAVVSPIIYLERCKGGCTIHKTGVDDSRTLSSQIPMGAATDYSLSEFENSAGQTGAAADAEWAEVVQCIREVYSPYAVQVTDVKPTSPTYHVNVVAGIAPQLGLPSVYLGVSPGVGCNPIDNRITYTFANAHGGSGARRVHNLCWTASQETAHTYSLDHAYQYADTRSACNDPMTYRTDCGGQKFFRNESATCGENTPRPCKCGVNQNSHLTLLSVFGPATPITAPPTITVSQPAQGAQIAAGSVVLATASSPRGIKSLELWLNGHKWGNPIQGAAFGADGQPETTYSIPIPSNVPDGVIDIVVKAKDDIDITTAAPTITVTKGAPCATADTCAAGQRCDAGRCLWDPAVGEIGETCSFPEFCLSGLCSGTATEQICTQSCITGVSDSCPAGFTCLETSPNKGICWVEGAGGGGCCSASNDTAAQGAFAALGLALVLRRRRRPARA